MDLTCTRCGSPVVPGDSAYVDCGNCQVPLFVDRASVVLHRAMEPTLDAARAEQTLRRWMAGGRRVKHLDQQAKVASTTFRRFPVWWFRLGDGADERIVTKPAAPISVGTDLEVPAGSMVPYDEHHAADAIEPDTPMQTALQWAEADEADVRERALVHVPLWFFKYDFQGQTWTAVVDAASGQVLAEVFPERSDLPYFAVAVAAVVLFLTISWIPAAGLVGGVPGVMLGVGVWCVLAPVLALPVVLVAAWVAARM